MAKRSIINDIARKQSSAYRGQRSTAAAIHQIDGSSRREASRRLTKPLKSWTGFSNFVSEAEKDKQAERAMNPHRYSKKRNPICPSCFIQTQSDGAHEC